jgi:hypothetical protein
MQSRLTREVVRVAQRARALQLVSACTTFLSLFVLCVLISTLLDALFRFPWFVRVGFLAAVLAVLLVHLRTRVLPAWKFRPTAVDLALRIERRRPELIGRLASAVEFDLGGITRASKLAARALSDAEERAVGADLTGILRKGPVAGRTLALVACLSVSLWIAVKNPSSTSIALQRLFVPFIDVRWPSRTGVVSLIEEDSVAARGRPFALRARLTEGDPLKERVRASYRVLPALDTASSPNGDSSDIVWTEVVLARQPSGDFERLIDTNGGAIEIRFLTNDAETDVVRVQLVEPPALQQATLCVNPPTYAEGVVARRQEELGTGLDQRAVVREPLLRGSEFELKVRLTRALPSGSERSCVRVLVDGAQAFGLSTHGEGAQGTPVTQEASGAQAEVAQQPVPSPLSSLFRVSVDESDPTSWTVSGRAIGATRIEMQLVDAYGITHDEPIAFMFDVSDDRAPSVTVVDPAVDESMVFDAKVALRVEARDDLALQEVGVEITVELATSAAENGAQTPAESEKVGERDDFGSRRGLKFEEGRSLKSQNAQGDRTRSDDATEDVTTPTLVSDFETTIDLAKLSVRAGDRLILQGYAQDAFENSPDTPSESTKVESEGRAAVVQADRNVSSIREQGRIRSAPRTIRIVGEEEFERQVRSMLGGVRREAMRADERQARAREALDRDASDVTVQEAQGALTESLGRLEEATREALERLKRNDRDDGVVGELATQALELAETARARSSESSAALSDAAHSNDQSQRDKSVQRAKAAQDEVRKELEDLVSLLDRDEDAWMARRRLDALAERVRQSARETAQAAARSSGESRDELSPEARAEIDALAERQRSSATEAEQLASELRERAKSLAEADAKQAQSLEQAARSLEEGRARDELEQGAAAAEDNRLEQSKAAQDRAAAAIAQASEALSENRKVRAEELARVLEELTESIKRLIRQTEPIEADVKIVTDAAGETAEIERDVLARAVGTISQNARGVAQDARAASRESARAARFVEDGAKSLSGAATKLRAEHFNRDDVSSEIVAALKSFDDALKAAEQAAERAEQRAVEEKKEELLAKYRGLLERQVGVKTSVEKLVRADGGQLGRREAIESRRLGITQAELRQSIAEIPNQESAVRDSDALAELHDLIDAALKEAASALGEAKPTNAIGPASDAIEALSFIVESLDESGEQEDSDEFGEQQQSAEGGEGGEGPQAGPVPPIAEIKILRSMQRALAERTKAVAEQATSRSETELRQAVAELAARQQRIIELATKIAEKLGAQPSGKSGVEAGPDGFQSDSDSRPVDNTKRGNQGGGADAPTLPRETKP